MRTSWILPAALLLSAAITPVAHAGIRTTPNLTSITFQEVTGVTTPFTFGANSAQMTAQLPGALGAGNRDFNGLSTESYDVFYSDANGVFDIDGNYVSVECRFDQSSGGGGCNIADVMLNFSNSPSVCACVVSSAVYLGSNQIAGSAANAADCLANTLSTMGNTSGTTQRLRITLDFSCRPTPTRSSTWGALKLHYR